jgi:hypothetical protein
LNSPLNFFSNYEKWFSQHVWNCRSKKCKNFESTNLPKGAAYGSGVYLAADSGTSFGYMQYTTGWKNSSFGSGNIGCLALCEVANHPMLKGQPNPYKIFLL